MINNQPSVLRETGLYLASVECPKRGRLRTGSFRASIGKSGHSQCITSSHLQRTAASLIGRFGQARFPSHLLGHCHSSGSRFSSQSGWCPYGTAACMCRIGSGEPCLETRFPSCAAAIFGFIHEPRPVRTTRSVLVEAVQFMLCPPPLPDGTQCRLPTYDAAGQPVCGQRQRQRAGGLLFA